MTASPTIVKPTPGAWPGSFDEVPPIRALAGGVEMTTEPLLAKARSGAARPQERYGGPAVAGDDRAVWAEAVAERFELLRGGRRVELPGEGVALANAEVVDGPDIEASQLEHQVHLGRP